MEPEKKTKRPRIGASPEISSGAAEQTSSGKTFNEERPQYQPRQYNNSYQSNNGYQRNYNRYDRSSYHAPYQAGHDGSASDEKVAETSDTNTSETSTAYNSQERSYQPRNNYNSGYNRNQNGYNNGYNRNYNNRNQNGYNRNQNGGYNQNGYNNRNQNGGYNQNGYNNRNQNGGYNQNGYNNRNQNGGYNQNGYNNRNQNGGYNQNGYNNRNQNGGYNQGGYNNRNQNGGYNQGGYNNRNQNGGYNQNGYNNRNQNGGFNQGGYNNRNRSNGYNNRNQNGYNKPGMKFMPRPQQIDYVLEDIDPNEPIRLNKFMANAGICSRREADEHIAAGLVKVNGEVVTELGTKISRDDVVEFNEKVVTPERKCYVLLNKPKSCVTTSDDPNGRLTVMDLVKNACEERIYPVGRLDRNTTGVLLLTNDGELASKLTHPKFVKKKIYHVWTDKPIAEEDMQRIADGIELEDGEIHADAISYVSDTDRNQAGIEIHSGRNRIVRRIFEHLGYHVIKLDRVYFAGLTKKNLPRGRWRYLTQEEVNYLRMGAFE
ncbi:MAG: pseudouridine synthase [Bacteroidales bacterium]|nr:pseudouridine synthase [Bacteroidales bacterium]